MAKRKKAAKKPRKKGNPPRNMGKSMDEMIVLESGCMVIGGVDPLLGILTILTPMGHYDFMLDEDSANDIVQQIRTFLSGDAEDLLTS